LGSVVVVFYDITFKSSGWYGLLVQRAAADLYRCKFIAGGGSQVRYCFCGLGGTVDIFTSVSFTGVCYSCIQADYGGVIRMNEPVAVTVTGVQPSQGFFMGWAGGMIVFVVFPSFVGSFTGCKYSFNTANVVGASLSQLDSIPGSVAGARNNMLINNVIAQ